MQIPVKTTHPSPPKESYAAVIVSGHVCPESSAKLLLETGRNMNAPGVPTLMTDGGGENLNSAVDELERSAY